jgi:hypothetical protein
MTAPDLSAIRDRAVELVELAPSGERARAERRVARLFGVRRRTIRRWVAGGDLTDGHGLRQDPLEPRELLPVRASTRAMALTAIFFFGLDRPLMAGATTGFVAVIALAPVWWPSVRHYVGARLLFATVLASLFMGWWLMQLASSDHSIDTREARSTVVLVLACFGAVGLILWARRFLPTSLVASAYGAGLLIANVPTVREGTLNWWKFGVAIPLGFILLGLCARSKSRVLPVAVLALLAAMSLANDSRSYSGFCVLTAVLVLYQHRHRGGRTGWRRLGQVAFLGGLVVAAYFLITSLLVQGYLGQELELRTRAQIHSSGSLIAGGRPEWSATLQLMKDRPLGYGLGVVPNGNDILVGKTGLDPLNIPTIDGYAEHYMFGGQFKLHSVAADLWSHFGLVGVGLAVVIAGLLTDALTRVLSDRTGTALLVFAIALALWDLAFGPIYSNLRYITLALGLALYRRDLAEGLVGGAAERVP